MTLDQLRAYWQHGARLPAGKPIVLTFDNGYHSQYAEALPVLKRLGWVADENIQLSGLPPSQGGLTDGEVHALVDAGWELDTQGISHADLITLDPSELHYQVATARQILRRRYGVPVNWFCYPSGHYNATVDRRRPRGRLRRLDDRRARLGRPVERQLHAAPPAGARRHEPDGAAGADRLDARRRRATESSYGGVTAPAMRGAGGPNVALRRGGSAVAAVRGRRDARDGYPAIYS